MWQFTAVHVVLAAISTWVYDGAVRSVRQALQAR